MKFLRNPGKYKSVSAFAPISNPSNCPWGQKAFNGYFGDDQAKWREHDATELIKKWSGPLDVLIDVVRCLPFPPVLPSPAQSSPGINDNREPATTSTNKANSSPRTSKRPRPRAACRASRCDTSRITITVTIRWRALRMIMWTMPRGFWFSSSRLSCYLVILLACLLVLSVLYI